MDENWKLLSSETIKWISLTIATIASIKGLLEYSKAQKYKKIEHLENLIKEFEDEKTKLARDLLDDFWLEDIKGKVIKYGNLSHVLRFHRPDGVIDKVEQEVRASFDKLLDFFSKLQYLRKLNLISTKDLYYFEYYLKKIFNNEAVMKYAEMYGYLMVKELKKDIIR